jgi:hypothetical protein
MINIGNEVDSYTYQAYRGKGIYSMQQYIENWKRLHDALEYMVWMSMPHMDNPFWGAHITRRQAAF